MSQAPPPPPPPTPGGRAPTPTGPARKRPYGWIAAVVAALFIGVGIGQSTANHEETASGTSSSPSAGSVTSTASPFPSPSPTEEANVDGSWRLTACDLQLFTHGFNTSTLVGAVNVTNTGNVPAAVTVSLKWDALPGPLFDGGTKTVTLSRGRSREIRFTKNIGQNDVDRVQSSPGYQAAGAGKLCKVRTSIDNA